jgi:hypothetical protein
MMDPMAAPPTEASSFMYGIASGDREVAVIHAPKPDLPNEKRTVDG